MDILNSNNYINEKKNNNIKSNINNSYNIHCKDKLHENIDLSNSINSNLLSKNQIKKLKKKQIWEANKHLIKKKLKEKEKLKKLNKKIINKNNENSNLVDVKLNESNNFDNQKQEVVKTIDNINEIIKTFPSKKEKTKLFIESTKKGFPIIIDCNYESFMNDKEIASIAKQLSLIYAIHKKSIFPFRLIFYNVGIKVLIELKKLGLNGWKGIEIMPIEKVNIDCNINAEYVDGINSWNKLKSYINVEDIVYLSGDSENVIDISNSTLHNNKSKTAYVIGGIVDKNRHKNLCLNISKDNNLIHAKLPIDNYIALKSCRILTTNHVFEIIENYKITNSWKEAFESIIPKRKQD